MKKVLSIAGSDCSGGAGIQADLKTFSAHGVFGMSVIVSVVAENTSRVIDIQDITPDMIEKQIDAVFEDIEVDAVKIGMLSTPECMKAVAKKLLQYKPQNVVIDPVMYAKNGCPLMNPTAVSTLIDTVIPLADVLTPNIPEAEKIADMQISTVSDMEAAARKIYWIIRILICGGCLAVAGILSVVIGIRIANLYKKYCWDTITIMVTLMSFAVTIYFGHWIKAVLPVNLLLLLLFVQAIYAAIRWYVKGWREARGYC